MNAPRPPSGFARATASTRKPRRIVRIPPSAWSDEWRGAPKEEVAVGVRVLSEGQVDVCRQEAVRHAWAAYQSQDGECMDAVALNDAYNDALMRQGICYALCDPNDLDKSWFEFPEVQVRQALSSEGVGFVWAEVARAQVELAPAQPEADDEHLAEIAERLRAGQVAGLPRSVQLEVRRNLRHALEALRAHAPIDPWAEGEAGMVDPEGGDTVVLRVAGSRDPE